MAQFDDGKDEGALRTIGEVTAATGIKPHILRYWESQFPSLTPLKRAGGRRLYRPEDVAAIRQIDSLLNREGYTLKGARAALKGNQHGQAEAGTTPAPAGSADQGDLLTRLKSIRDELATALAAA